MLETNWLVKMLMFQIVLVILPIYCMYYVAFAFHITIFSITMGPFNKTNKPIGN